MHTQSKRRLRPILAFGLTEQTAHLSLSLSLSLVPALCLPSIVSLLHLLLLSTVSATSLSPVSATVYCLCYMPVYRICYTSVSVLSLYLIFLSAVYSVTALSLSLSLSRVSAISPSLSAVSAHVSKSGRLLVAQVLTRANRTEISLYRLSTMS